MTNIATVSDEELQHTREIYANLATEGRELDPANEFDRMHARGIFPFALELIDEVLRQRKWAREMVEMAASGGRLDGYRELADKLAAKDGEIERMTEENRRLRADLLAGRNVVNAGLTIHTLTAERDEARQRAEYWKAEHLAGNAEVERLRSELYDCIGALPGTAYYLDPPDGGSVTIAEQLRRMGEDAARYRHLRACVYIDPQQSILRIANVYLCRDDGPDVAAQLDAAIDAARGKE